MAHSRLKLKILCLYSDLKEAKKQGNQEKVEKCAKQFKEYCEILKQLQTKK